MQGDEPRTVYFIPGGANALERVFEQCRRENGGLVLGNPTIQSDLTGIAVEGGRVTLVIIEDRADPQEWWQQWAKVHGWKFTAGPVAQQ